MQDLASLAPAINREGYVYAYPQAPLGFQIGPGMIGYGWTPRGPEATIEDIQNAEQALDTFFVEIMEKYQVPSGNVILSGFSQGGGMTYRCGLRQPNLFAGLAVLSGTLPDTGSLRARLPEARNQPIFVAHGTVDAVLPIERGRAAPRIPRIRRLPAPIQGVPHGPRNQPRSAGRFGGVGVKGAAAADEGVGTTMIQLRPDSNRVQSGRPIGARPISTAERVSIDAIIEPLGGWDLVNDKMRAFHEATKRFFSDYESLVQQYPGKVVALGLSGVLTVGDSVEEVSATCESEGLHPLDYWVEHLDPTPPVRVL